MRARRTIATLAAATAILTAGCGQGDGVDTQVDTQALCREAERGADRIEDVMDDVPDRFGRDARTAGDFVDDMHDAVAPFPVIADVFSDLGDHYDGERAETLEAAGDEMDRVGDALLDAVAEARDIAQQVDRGRITTEQGAAELERAVATLEDMDPPDDDLVDDLAPVIDDIEDRCDDVDFDRVGDLMRTSELFSTGS